jgi:hypothetical protein
MTMNEDALDGDELACDPRFWGCNGAAVSPLFQWLM